jgi:hypothetical protein
MMQEANWITSSMDTLTGLEWFVIQVWVQKNALILGGKVHLLKLPAAIFIIMRGNPSWEWSQYWENLNWEKDGKDRPGLKANPFPPLLPDLPVTQAELHVPTLS